jgi:hypothetical protein
MEQLAGAMLFSSEDQKEGMGAFWRTAKLNSKDLTSKHAKRP